MPTLEELNQKYEPFFQGLDLCQAFTPELGREFTRASIDNKQKILFTLPLPAIQKYNGRQSGGNSTQKESMFPPLESTYEIDGQQFRFKYSSYQHVNQFSTPIWNKNKLSEDQFVSKYVEPYLNQDHKYGYIYRTHNGLKILFRSLQYKVQDAKGEAAVQRTVKRCLHNPIHRPVVATLESSKNKVISGLGNFLEDKGTDITPKNGPVQLDSMFIPEMDLKFLGISVRPDAICGYRFSKRKDTTAYGVGLIEIKTPTFKMNESYNKLCRTTPDDVNASICFDRYGMTKAKGQVLELQKEIRKYVTTCVHSGCDRFIICDYNSVLFVHVDKSVSLLKDDRENFDEEMPPDSSEDSDVESEQEIMVASPGGRSLPVRSSRDKTRKGTEKKMIPLILISSSHFLVKRTHRNIRLFTLAFLAMNDQRLTDMSSFQKNVIEVITKEQKKTEKEATQNIPTSSPGSAESSGSTEKGPPTKRQNTGNQQSFETLSGANAPPVAVAGECLYAFDKDNFTEEHIIDLGSITKKLLRVESMLRSQVIAVDCKKFTEMVGSGRCYHEETPNTTALKIFDPLWGEELEDESGEFFKYEYSDAIAACVNELKVFSQLKPLMGQHVPFVFSYGRLSDHHISSGTTYTRFWGPYLEMQFLERDELLTEDLVEMDFVRGSIVPVFRELHRLHVLHGDVKFSNIIITRERRVFIVNFGKSVITDDK